MKKRVGIITFHASYNYGSMLQAYALQSVITRMGYDCEIINFRTDRQKDMYRLPWQRGGIFNKVKRGLMYLPIMCQLKRKQRLFETFLNEEYHLSEMEYHTSDELKNADLEYDYYVSGSDQIWNTTCRDFDNVYFLDFVKDKTRIAYAPSLGPKPSFPEEGDIQATIKAALRNYDYISVRETGSAMKIRELIGTDVPVAVDPTLLLDSEEWIVKAGKEPIIKGEYVFLYSPWPDVGSWKYAKKLAKLYKVKVVVSNIYSSSRDNIFLFDPTFCLHLPVGPKEFLNLCRHAKYVVGQSFHLAVFCIHMRKPFVIVGGADDSRVFNLLDLTGLMSRTIGGQEDILMKFENTDIDFEYAMRVLKIERGKCLDWLGRCLSCNNAH